VSLILHEAGTGMERRVRLRVEPVHGLAALGDIAGTEGEDEDDAVAAANRS